MNTTTSFQELIYSILEIVRPRALTNELINEWVIAYECNAVRSQLIKQDINRGYSIDSYIIQDLGCLDMELVDQAECCEVSTGCKILRTVLQIPSPIEMHQKQAITRIGPILKTARPYDFINYNRVPYVGRNSKFSKKIIRTFTKDNDGHIYIVADEELDSILLEKINVQGVWEDPRLVANFRHCSGEPCYTEESAYPVKAWMIPIIQQIVVEKFIGPQTKDMKDSENDGKPEYKYPLDKD